MEAIKLDIHTQLVPIDPLRLEAIDGVRWDAAANTLSIPYFLEHGERFAIEPMQVGQGFASHVIRTRKPLVINYDIERWKVELGSKLIGDPNATQAPEQSYVGVPIIRESMQVASRVFKEYRAEAGKG